ncbi:hypothetical protein COT51_00590, partial [candidate division WWE3 bacterium CG08_land_8_20_14_0_20_41_15]
VSTNKDFTGSSWNTLVSTTSSKDVSKDVTIDVSNYLPNLKSGETITIYLELKDQAGNETEASSISDTIVYQPTASSVVANTVTSTISNVANTVKEKVENVFKPKEEEKIEEKSIPDSTQSTNYQLPTTQSPLSFWQRLIKFIKELFRR